LKKSQLSKGHLEPRTIWPLNYDVHFELRSFFLTKVIFEDLALAFGILCSQSTTTFLNYEIIFKSPDFPNYLGLSRL
jgi:hypothetical protein